jgi:hypothetical protein
MQLSFIGRTLTAFLTQKWYVDRVYNETLGPLFIKWGYTTSYRALDKGLIESSGPVGGWKISQHGARWMHQFQSGYLYHASFWMVVCLAFFLAFAFVPLLLQSASFLHLPLVCLLLFSLLFI